MLVQIAPIILDGNRFALKGGTAINLFERDMPRLSVDLDLVVQDGTLDRPKALAEIDLGLKQAKASLERLGFRLVSRSTANGEDTKLEVGRDGIAVKVEVNHVMRGTIRAVRRADLVPLARETLQAEITVPVLAGDELYGSKLVAAMDRQHPRDLFDVVEMYDHGGLNPAMVESFTAYLACHNRPVDEVLFPTEKDIAEAYLNQFVGMTAVEVSLDRLLMARQRLMRDLPRQLTEGQRTFLRSLVRVEPDFVALALPRLERLPAMQWKLMNLRNLRDRNRRKFEQQVDALERKFGEMA